MINFKKLFQIDKSQTMTSKLKKLYQSEEWGELSDTETENIQGGWPFPPPPPTPPGLPGNGGWEKDDG